MLFEKGAATIRCSVKGLSAEHEKHLNGALEKHGRQITPSGCVVRAHQGEMTVRGGISRQNRLHDISRHIGKLIVMP